MADKIQYYDLNIASGATSTGTLYMDKYDQLMVRVPAVSTIFSASSVVMNLKASPNPNYSNVQTYYYDYVALQPGTCCVTVSTAGIYEFPYPGANNYVQIEFDVPATQATAMQLIGPKTTY